MEKLKGMRVKVGLHLAVIGDRSLLFIRIGQKCKIVYTKELRVLR